MISEVFRQSRASAQARVWVFSDLQQQIPERAEDCLSRALDDIHELDAGLTHLWYLGDAMEGKEPGRVAEMTAMQVQQLSALGRPLRFVMGNHDLDCTSKRPAGSTPDLPAWEAFRKVPGWKTTDAFHDFFFTETYGDTLVVFLSDHVAPDNRWFATQQEIRGEDPSAYPWTLEEYQRLRTHMEAWPGPVLIAGHYAFPGGARGTPQGGPLTRLLPLPDNVKLVLHGHAHTGDWKWAREKTFQRIGWIDWHNVPQINVSSLDRYRGTQSRSVILDLHADGNAAVFFRDHEDKTWSDAYLTNFQAPRSVSDFSQAHHQAHTNLDGTSLHAWTCQHP